MKFANIVFLIFLGVFGFTALVSAGATGSQDMDQVEKTSKFVEGVHYHALEKPLPNAAPLTKFFAYGCLGCYQMRDLVFQWQNQTRKTVSLVPVNDMAKYAESAQIFHTLEVMGVVGKVYELGYHVYLDKSSELQGIERINHYLKEFKVDQTKFWEVWVSEAVKEKMKTSAVLTRWVGVEKTPTFIVNGQYKVVMESVESLSELFDLFTFIAYKKR